MFAFAAIAKQLLVSLAMSVVAYAIMPKPKVDQSASTRDFEDPTAEAGRPIPVLLGGDMWIGSPNILWFGEKRTEMVKR